ncbi:MAG: alpha-hydroxy-acid oxidizing protein, partial [Cohaesibacter sp.]|nr:alpha-hydroxy-acid oxidizing protein [Cohaesibacter sp.]
LTPQMIWQIAQKPLWALDMLQAGTLEVELIKGHPEFGQGALAQASALSSRLDKNLTWETVRQLRKDWDGKLVVKGIADVDDAIQASKEDIDGIVLSNHGGRQLDHGMSTISMVADIRKALGVEKMLYVDSGFRRGSDIIKAVALGADFVLLGRPFTWSMAAEGQRGVEKVFDILKTEMEITLQLMGMSSLDELKAQGASALKFL